MARALPEKSTLPIVIPARLISHFMRAFAESHCTGFGIPLTNPVPDVAPGSYAIDAIVLPDLLGSVLNVRC